MNLLCRYTFAVPLVRYHKHRWFTSSQFVQQYLPENHWFILKGNNESMYTSGTKLDLKLSDGTSYDPSNTQPKHIDPPSFIIPAPSSSSTTTLSGPRSKLFAERAEMTKSVFFYNESNPHAGIISNLQFLLYDYYQLIGPVRQSWAKVLLKDSELVDLLNHHLQEDCTIYTLAGMIESLSAKREVSMCKYQSTVTDNKVQLRKGQLTAKELVVLEVLAQYGFYDYEVINW